MKLILYFLTLLGTISIVQAQDTSALVVDTSRTAPVPRVKRGQETGGLSNEFANKIFTQQFSLLLTGKTNTGVGNYADLDMADGKVSFQGSLIDKKGSVFSITAAGGVNEGLLNLFDHSKFSTDISLDFQYNFLDFRKRQLVWTDPSFRLYETAKIAAYRQYFTDSLTIFKKQQVTLWETEILALDAKNTKLTADLKAIKGAMTKSKQFTTGHRIPYAGHQRTTARKRFTAGCKKRQKHKTGSSRIPAKH